MQTPSIMLVSLTVTQSKEAEFSRFYQQEFLPAVLDVVPEFATVRRYEAFGDLAKEWNRRRTLSLYEITSREEAEAAFTGFARPRLAEMVSRFGQWKETDFSDFTRVLFHPVYEHLRRPTDGHFGNRPLIVLSHEIKSDLLGGFQKWLQEKYLPRLMADVPTLVACRQYESSGVTPSRHIVILECQDQQSLPATLNDMSAQFRCDENEALNKWEDVALDFRDAVAFKQTFRFPG